MTNPQHLLNIMSATREKNTETKIFFIENFPCAFSHHSTPASSIQHPASSIQLAIQCKMSKFAHSCEIIAVISDFVYFFFIFWMSHLCWKCFLPLRTSSAYSKRRWKENVSVEKYTQLKWISNVWRPTDPVLCIVLPAMPAELVRIRP